VRYFIEDCGLSVDELTPRGHLTPLSFLCQYVKKDMEEQALPVVKYLLAHGADIEIGTSLGRTPKQIALEKERLMVLQHLTSHETILEGLQCAERWRQEAAAREVAKQRKVEEAVDALFRMEAEEALARSKDRKTKGSKGYKKKERGSSAQGPPQADRKEEVELEEDDGSKEGKEEEEEEEKGGGNRRRQQGSQHDEEGSNAMVADVAASTASMTLAEGKGDEDGELEASGIGKSHKLGDDDLLEDAPDDYVCPLEMCLMTEDPVLASDGFAYSKKGLERWISHCAAKGLPLTSPRTGLPMEAAFMLNMTHRTLVREWVEKRKEMGQKM